jgi:2-hydroxychromene-2-carboxylate isomerase
MRLDIYLDLGNIAGYAALPGTLALIEKTAIETAWWPIEGIVPRPLSRAVSVNVDDPLQDYKQKRLAAKHQLERDELDRDCDRLGLNPEVAKQSFTGELTHLAWLAMVAAGIAPLPFIQRVYELRLREGNSLEDEQTVAELAAEFGVLDLVGALPELANSWVQHQAAYLELGVHDSPAYVLAGETFQGRQHLPLLAWRIDGEIGPPPL